MDPAGNGQRKNDFDNGRPVNNRTYVWDWGGGEVWTLQERFGDVWEMSRRKLN